MKHGYATRKNRHPLYTIWGAMIGRCYNENNNAYKNYGGRGIIVCNEWKNDPVSFIKWAENNNWNNRLLLDRRNNNGFYTPKNCRFVSASINCTNQRKRKDNSSGFRGVSLHKGRKEHRTNDKWDATIQYKKNRIHVGSFDDLMEAVIARDNFIKENNLPHKLNLKDAGAGD